MGVLPEGLRLRQSARKQTKQSKAFVKALNRAKNARAQRIAHRQRQGISKNGWSDWHNEWKYERTAFLNLNRYYSRHRRIR